MHTDVFNVPSGFKIEALVGQGAYGAVCKATRTKTNEAVAIKKIPHYNRSDDNATKVLRELQILHHFQPVRQVVQCYEVFLNSEANNTVKDIYIVMDYIDADLSTLLRKSVIRQEAVIQFIIGQLLLGLRAMHKDGCIHRDLSTRNILVNSKSSEIFICDFGLSRFYDPEEKMSYGVVTQWYRAPEVITDAEYDFKVDVWAVGVVMAELFMQQHLFPGRPNDLADQLKKILLCVGMPNWEWFCQEGGTSPPPEGGQNTGNSTTTTPQEATVEGDATSTTSKSTRQPFLSASGNAKKYIESFIKHMSSRSAHPVTAESGNFVHNLPYRIPPSDLAKDLLSKLLAFNPRQRLSAQEALDHPWFTSSSLIAYIKDEMDCQNGMSPFVGAMPKGVDKLCRSIETLVTQINKEREEAEEAEERLGEGEAREEQKPEQMGETKPSTLEE